MSSYACKNLHKCINYQLFIPKCSFFRYFIVNLLLYSTNLVYFCTEIEDPEGKTTVMESGFYNHSNHISRQGFGEQKINN